MSKLFLENKVPPQYDRATFADIFRAIQNQVNPLSEGKGVARYNAQESVPSSVVAVVFAVCDFIPDSNCTVRGSAGSQYVRKGWICVSPGDGATATFAEERVLTGT